MKKFSLLSSVLLLIAVVTFLAVGCQKDSAATSDSSAASNSESPVVKGLAADEPLIGVISPDHADQMAADFARQFPDVQTQYVTYSTKNLINYLNTLLTKYKSDSVSVCFGLYNSTTAPNPGYVGRATIFFMGQNFRKGNNGNVKLAGESDDASTNYLNQGTLIP